MKAIPPLETSARNGQKRVVRVVSEAPRPIKPIIRRTYVQGPYRDACLIEVCQTWIHHAAVKEVKYLFEFRCGNARIHHPRLN